MFIKYFLIDINLKNIFIIFFAYFTFFQYSSNGIKTKKNEIIYLKNRKDQNWA